MRVQHIIETIELRGEGGLRLVADVAGPASGPTVLLLHGGGQTRHSWRRTLGSLADAGWRAFSQDLRGHGDSAWSEDGAYDLPSFAADVREVARQLPRRPVVVGASLGGIAALLAVGESTEPVARALVLVDVAPQIEAAGSQRVRDFMLERATAGFGSLDEVADAIAAYNPHRPRPTDLAGLHKNVRQRADGRWIWRWDPRVMQVPTSVATGSAAAAEPVARMEAAARMLTIPTLLVRGRVSDLLSREGALAFQRLVPQAELVDVEGAGHMIAGDRNDLFNAAIVEFLRTIGA